MVDSIPWIVGTYLLVQWDQTLPPQYGTIGHNFLGEGCGNFLGVIWPYLGYIDYPRVILTFQVLTTSNHFKRALVKVFFAFADV